MGRRISQRKLGWFWYLQRREEDSLLQRGTTEIKVVGKGRRGNLTITGKEGSKWCSQEETCCTMINVSKLGLATAAFHNPPMLCVS